MNNPNIQPTNQQNQQLPPQYMPQGYAAPMHDPDEINLLEYVYVLVKAKWWILGAAVLGLVVGSIAAYVKGPRYVAEVVIAPRETESQKMPNLSALGALGGLAAAQFGLGGNASLDKIETIINSREFNAAFIDKFNLLPSIFRIEWPKPYKKMWDPSTNNWRSDFLHPKRLDMGSLFKSKYIKSSINKNNTMSITATTPDSTLSDSIMTWYIAYLSEYFKTQIQTDANNNVEYLYKQLSMVSDPLLREKFLSLIASEIEKAMMVSNEAFKIVDPVYRNRVFREKRLYPNLLSAGFFLLSMLFTILRHVFLTSKNIDEDSKLISLIRREAFNLPLSRLK